MKEKNKRIWKRIFLTLAALAVVGGLVWVWKTYISPTRIAFVNYQVIQLGEIAKANDNPFIQLEELPVTELNRADDYDMVFVNGMGLRLTAEQREPLEVAALLGTPVLTTASTNPDNYIVSVDEVTSDTLVSYLSGASRRNYRSMLNYVRRYVDGKSLGGGEVLPPTERAFDLLSHPNLDAPDDEPVGFNSVAAYEAYLESHGRLHADAPAVIVTGQMGDPNDLILALEASGDVVYHVNQMRGFLMEGHADSLSGRLAAVVNMAHGRMGDYMVRFLEQRNVPLFCPLNVNRLDEEWMADRLGMNGGFLSQSVVTPEIDGALRPYALFAHRRGEDGLQEAYTMPDRLADFVQTVNNYASLQRKPNSEKRVAIYYFKGPGQNALVATGLEVAPSLYNLLCRLRDEGYNVEGLPESPEALARLIQTQGAVFNTYAEGAFDDFMMNGNPELIARQEYEAWVRASLRPEAYAEVVAQYGDFPGSYMTTEDGRLAVARIRLGNIVLMPQNMAGVGSNAFEVVHGTDTAPTHTFLASYLWMQHAFKADALIHFGTHGGLEYTPRKQNALSPMDWPDRFVGAVPHFYIYTIGNVGEALIAKRRTYAGIQSHLTAPFLESGVRDQYKTLDKAIQRFNYEAGQSEESSSALREASLAVKRATLELGICTELGLDTLPDVPFTEAEVSRVESFAEELANEKITGEYYTLGEPYKPERIESSVYAMATDPIAFSLLALDKQLGRARYDTERHKSLFTTKYMQPARALVGRLLQNPALATDAFICQTAGITQSQLDRAREIDKARQPVDMMTMMMAMGARKAEAKADSTGNAEASNHSVNTAQAEPSDSSARPDSASLAKMREMGKGMNPKTALQMAKLAGASPEALKKMAAAMGVSAARPKGDGISAMMNMSAAAKPKFTDEEVNLATAIVEVERTLRNVGLYRRQLLESPEAELHSMMNALGGGFTSPSAGGDVVSNPQALPTGRNLYGINAENTPTENAWEKGCQMARRTIELYKERHNDSIPRKVSYTLWSGEFIETEGATVAQVLYMLGVEPVRDGFGRVTDLRLIPSRELGRPRIDVVVQTSGQLRDLAASRLFLINRAVQMAAAAEDDAFENQVAAGVLESEKTLAGKGLSPADARRMSTRRVFGGVNGNYGTGITAMVQAGDRWESEAEIANVYLNNMSAFYGAEDEWEEDTRAAFEAALTRTDAVIQPRQSNTWGALSLDHVYEFMGGMDLAVRNVTGHDPDAYLSDYRNRNNYRMQEVKEAIGVESRTTVFNPTYIREKMQGGASGAAAFAEVIQNTYGWNVMKPEAVDERMWNEVYEVYVKDKFGLGTQQYFERENPAALQEMTAVMLETVRKGLWHASSEQVQDIARLHVDLVNRYQPSCSGFVCDNAKLRDFIARQTEPDAAENYRQQIQNIRESAATRGKEGKVMRREQTDTSADSSVTMVSGAVVAGIVVLALVILALVVRKRRRED